MHTFLYPRLKITLHTPCSARRAAHCSTHCTVQTLINTTLHTLMHNLLHNFLRPLLLTVLHPVQYKQYWNWITQFINQYIDHLWQTYQASCRLCYKWERGKAGYKCITELIEDKCCVYWQILVMLLLYYPVFKTLHYTTQTMLVGTKSAPRLLQHAVNRWFAIPTNSAGKRLAKLIRPYNLCPHNWFRIAKVSSSKLGNVH